MLLVELPEGLLFERSQGILRSSFSLSSHVVVGSSPG